MSAPKPYVTFNPSEFTNDRLEAVITCRGYADFLFETLPFNLPHFDRVVVVTSPDDKQTIEICRHWSIETIQTTAFSEGGASFNKGHAINVGLGALRQRGWVLHIDADIVLPLTFRNMLGKSSLERDRIYGAERANVVGYQRWSQLKSTFHVTPQFSSKYLVTTPEDLPIGANVVHKEQGYVPIGFFQLWHSEYSLTRDMKYPDNFGSAEQSDVQWAIRWPRKDRILLPTVRVFHLESAPAPFGANWDGRTTPPFTKNGKALSLKSMYS